MISSGGGHWAELLRLTPALHDFVTIYSSTHNGYAKDVQNSRFVTITDSNRNKALSGILTFFMIVRIFLLFRPTHVVTTGALPGLLAIMVGKIFRARTMWIDSIANHDELSLSGQYASWFADEYLTQWEHLANKKKLIFKGKAWRARR